MPKGTKSSTRATKEPKVAEEDEIEVTEKRRPKRKVKKEEVDDDVLEEIDIDAEQAPQEVAHKHVDVPHLPRRPPTVDGSKPMVDYSPEEIMSYLIQVGHDTLNPRLKHGMINLLNELKGRRRRRNVYGSKRSMNHAGNKFGQRGRNVYQPGVRGPIAVPYDVYYNGGTPNTDI